MGRKLFFSAAAIWALLAFVFLIVGTTPGESRLTADFMMMMLGFPVNFFASEYLNLNVHGSLGQYVFEWGVLFVLGFGQWFVLPYWLWLMWSKRRASVRPK